MVYIQILVDSILDATDPFVNEQAILFKDTRNFSTDIQSKNNQTFEKQAKVCQQTMKHTDELLSIAAHTIPAQIKKTILSAGCKKSGKTKISHKTENRLQIKSILSTF